MMSDVIMKEMERMDTVFDTVVGVAINGVPLAVLISEELGAELTIYRPPQDNRTQGGGTLCSNYAEVEGKNVVVVDDVLSTGETMEGAVHDMKEHGAEPVLCVVSVDKGDQSDIENVPLRSLIHARVIS
jgi:orotate phosphoribosyltransferase